MTTLSVVGRLGRDTELRYTPSGQQVVNLAVAYNYGRKNEEGRRPTQWVDAVLWGEQAARLQPYLLKGTGVEMVLRDVHVEEYQRHDHTVGHRLTGTVVHFEFAPTQRSGDSPAAPARPASTPRPAAPANGPGGDGFDDEIPF